MSGLRFLNPSGGLVMSSDGIGQAYIGQPTLDSTVPSDAFALGWYVHTIDSDFPPIVLCEIPPDTYVALKSLTNLGGGTWEIQTWSCTTTLDANDFNTLTAPTLHAFARVTARAEDWGGQMWDALGDLAWDLTRPQLWLRGSALFPASGTGQLVQAVPEIDAPAIFGKPSGRRILSTGTGPTYPTRTSELMWLIPSGIPDQLERRWVVTDYSPAEDSPSSTTDVGTARAMLIDTTPL